MPGPEISITDEELEISAAIHASYEALNKIVGDPAGLGREETMKALKEMMVAIDAPNGWEAAQDSVMPFFMSVLDFWEAGDSIPINMERGEALNGGWQKTIFLGQLPVN